MQEIIKSMTLSKEHSAVLCKEDNLYNVILLNSTYDTQINHHFRTLKEAETYYNGYLD